MPPGQVKGQSALDQGERGEGGPDGASSRGMCRASRLGGWEKIPGKTCLRNKASVVSRDRKRINFCGAGDKSSSSDGHSYHTVKDRADAHPTPPTAHSRAKGPRSKPTVLPQFL